MGAADGADGRRAARAATRIYVIRHGETDWNRRGVLQGTADVPLNATGIAQAARLADALRAVPLDAAYTSPLARARATAAAVCATQVRAGRVVVPAVLDDLREIGYGRWQGLDVAACEVDDPALRRLWADDPWAVRFPGGESLVDVEARVRRVLATLRARHPGQAVLVSGHGHLNRVLLLVAHGWPRERFWGVEQPNAGCVVVELSADAPAG